MSTARRRESPGWRHRPGRPSGHPREPRAAPGTSLGSRISASGTVSSCRRPTGCRRWRSSGEGDGVVSGARAVYLGLVWIYLAGIVVQVFLAGVGLFGATHDFELPRNLGWILHLGPVLLLIVAAVARVGARTIW